MMKSITKFKHGSQWLRADFHLHTKADKEFTYNGEENSFVSDYIAQLKAKQIDIGVITNHNKFDYDEFKALRKKAKKEEIFLIPGVELSVNDGSNGIHTLIVFSEEWVEKENDYISPFITSMFPGKSQNEYQNENARSDKNILQVVEELDKTGREYFIVFAHVEQKSGLWYEMSGGKIGDFTTKRYGTVRKRSLGFQKVRTPEREKVQGWLKDWYPAEVEGSDPKAIEEIGKGQTTYLKIGCYSTASVMYALFDHKNRISKNVQVYKHSHIISVSFDGGVLDGETIDFSPELNTLIGIRGSGKSSIVESLRYALDIPFGIKSLDVDYKNSLIDHVLGSGGKITILAVDARGQLYEIRRINKETSDVYVNGILQPGISIRETILNKPIYFGQKDLSATGDGFEKDLVEKLVGEKLYEIRHKIELQREKVSEKVSQLKKLSDTAERKKEYGDKKRDAEFRLKFYKDHGVEEKLQKQIDFDTDSRKCSTTVTYVETYLQDLDTFINQHEDDLKNLPIYTSRQNEKFFEDLFATYSKLLSSFTMIKNELSTSIAVARELKMKANAFEKIREGLKEEFAEIERKLSEQLRLAGAQAIKPNEFRQLRKIVEQSKQMLKILDKQELTRVSLQKELLKELATLNDLWREEYKAIQLELDKVNSGQSSLKIKAEFKGDKGSFIDYMKDMLRGSRIRESTITSISNDYSDFGNIYKEFPKVKSIIGSSADIFEKYFNEHLSSFLTWQVPNRFIIEYRGKELKHHSLGQRASALILFVLSQQENDLFIIDQPEDDLDNQTIYEDVIKLIRNIKSKTQFIFATHNANFPVLGDAEQIISCEYSNDKINITSGSIDNPQMQQQIVDIMEGGEEAFNQRKRRYEIWKPQN